MRNGSRELAFLSVEIDRLALKGVDSHDRNEVLCKQLANAIEFLRDDLCLASVGVLLGLQATNFVLKLHNPSHKLRALAFTRGATGLEETLFSSNDVGHIRIGKPFDKLARRVERFVVVPLGLETRLPAGGKDASPRAPAGPLHPRVLALWGTSDWLVDRASNAWIAEVINRTKPGNGTFVALDAIDHFFFRAASPEESYQIWKPARGAPARDFNPVLLETLRGWLDETVGRAKKGAEKRGA